MLSTFSNPGNVSSITKETLVTDAENDFSALTGHGGHTGKHDPEITTDLTCLGGQPINCTTEGISGGAWESSILQDPVLLTYDVLPLTELITTASGFTQEVGVPCAMCNDNGTQSFVGLTDPDKCYPGFQLFGQ